MEPARPPSSPNPIENEAASALRLPCVPPLGGSQTISSLIPSQSSHCHFLGSLTVSGNREVPTNSLELTLGHITQWLSRFFPTHTQAALTSAMIRGAGSLRYGDSHLSTLCHRTRPSEDGEYPLHAIALEHTDRHLSGRRWRTEIVMKELPNNQVKLYIGLYHGLRAGFIGEPPKLPSPSTPALLHALLLSPRVNCYYDVVKSVESPLQVHDTAQQAEIFARLLLHPNRSNPIVLMNLRLTPHGELFAWDPYALTKGCFGSGTIVVPSSSLQVDGPFLSTLAQKLGPHGYRYVAGLKNGGVRVFQPRMATSFADDFKRHRYFHPTQGPDVPRWIQDGLRHTLRASLDAKKEIFTFDGVQRAIANSAEDARLLQLQERIKDAIAPEQGIAIEQERDNLKKLVVALQEEINTKQRESGELSELQGKHTQLEEELKVAQELLDGASTQIDDLQDQLDVERESRFKAEQESLVYKQLLDSKQGADTSRKVLAIPSRLPTEPHEVVTLLAKQLAPRVIILDTAIDSSHQIPLTRLNDTWECLVALHEVLWPLHFGESDETDDERKAHRIPAKFMEKTGIDYSVNESAMTNRDSDLMRQRRVTVDGVEFDFSAHLKVGNKAKDALRIHFAIDDDNKRVLVWHCGEHLDTAGTRRKK